ncbi:2-dehydro-3-deoxygalactonokinase [Novosphingobium sp. PASSN1]|uniref:2-dehydro-3-deoxygalactonokinase n=1 Tax=Novosphingobium sp. PASSN1 TaxID=2015561 RepID=UPI000BD811F2|nr:2-dehydro-3-deoxygalactonokinase [Novosphingobium sp. PASSN1]OYU33860.1 MAG: 2-dehydro-3-deoxygalactonokinase [Novosphingobium sp. PASSN1]
MSWHALGDWGTSNLRLYRVEDGRVTDRRDGPGIGALPGSPADALREALAPWVAAQPPAGITLCGMAGSRGGLQEAPYVDCPASVEGWAGAALSLDFEGTPLHIAPGLACMGGDGAPDVMRGEETQIFGALALDADLGTRSCHFVLPGTHSKWARIERGQIRDFRTCLSGELFALLRDHSVLLGLGTPTTPADEPQGFVDGLDRAANGGGLVGSLFEARAQQLRGGRSASWALGFLSGLVIGNEIADMRGGLGPEDAVVLIGTAELTERYGQALQRFGVTAKAMDGAACAMRGLEFIDAHH